jgi:hypothetical protein
LHQTSNGKLISIKNKSLPRKIGREKPIPPPKKKKKKRSISRSTMVLTKEQEMLSIIEEEKVPVTFFVIGEHTEASRYQQMMWDSLQVLDDSLADICNH